jgi:hypothetical protein
LTEHKNLFNLIIKFNEKLMSLWYR